MQEESVASGFLTAYLRVLLRFTRLRLAILLPVVFVGVLVLVTVVFGTIGYVTGGSQRPDSRTALEHRSADSNPRVSQSLEFARFCLLGGTLLGLGAVANTLFVRRRFAEVEL